MAVPKQYANNFVAIKYMLSSYRALADGRAGIRHLEEMLSQANFLFSEWKIVWIGVCATLRSSIDLFQVDARSCLPQDIRSELRSEWNSIKADADAHPIYWEFLKKERDNIIHEYSWTAYEAWLEPDGTIQAPPTILGRLLAPSDAKPALLMRHGRYSGQNSLLLLSEAADWAEARIFNALERAGFSPDEKRSMSDFRKMPDVEVAAASLLAKFAQSNA
jgi:hypothetical protein